MLFTAQNIKNTLIMCIVMAITLFLLRSSYSEIEFNAINLVLYLLSAVLGVVLVFLYLCAFPGQRKNRFLTFFIPGAVLAALLVISGLSNLWLIDELVLMLSFIFGGQEISKTVENSPSKKD